MYAKPVLQRVKDGLGEEIVPLFQVLSSNGPKERKPQPLLEEFLRNALQELAQHKHIRKQLTLTIDPIGIVLLPDEVRAVESVQLKNKPLTPKKDHTSLSSSEYSVDLAQRIIRLAKDTTGVIDVNYTVIPGERDIPPDGRHALVLHVKAQCCEYIAKQLRKNPSLKISKKRGLLNDPVHWEREGGKLRLKISNEPPIAS
jgi:hypothetical protein